MQESSSSRYLGIKAASEVKLRGRLSRAAPGELQSLREKETDERQG